MADNDEMLQNGIILYKSEGTTYGSRVGTRHYIANEKKRFLNDVREGFAGGKIDGVLWLDTPRPMGDLVKLIEGLKR